MKQHNIFITFILMTCYMQNITAQSTVVTEQYLTNADFSSTIGWTEHVSSSYKDYGNGRIGTYTVRTDVGSAATVDGTHLSSEYCFGFETRWSNSYASYYQETKTSLPNGVYELTYDVQNTNTNTVKGNYGNLFYVQVGDNTYTDTYTEWMNGYTNWTTHTITFVITSATKAKISLGVGSGTTNYDHKKTPVVYVSHLKLTHRPLSEVTESKPADMTAIVGTSMNEWIGGTGSYTAGNVLMTERYFDDTYRTGVMMEQTVKGLPIGLYNVELYAEANWTADRGGIKTAAATEGTEVSHVFVNDATMKVPLAYKTSSTGPRAYNLPQVTITDGTLRMGLVNDVNGANWILIQIKSLKYLGQDKKLYEESFNERYSIISSYETHNVPMNSAFATEIQTLTDRYKDMSAAEMTLSELEIANEDMLRIINAYDDNINAYVNIKKYIEMTKVFTDVAAYEANYKDNIYTIEDVEAIRQQLNIKRYEAASEIFTNKVDVTGWVGDLANVQRSDQHWSGKTISYYDANSWTDNYIDLIHELSTELTLPKGKYVLKAAGRCNKNVTMSLNILARQTIIESVEYVGKGDTGKGIDIDGNATFSNEATYANNGLGRGWEWEFAQFELAEETAIKLNVKCDYNNTRNLFGSFSDITLWMDDETYVTMNSHAIDIPLAEAKTLVDTKPMSITENSALQEAIALCDNQAKTPEELKRQISTLSTAINNAKDWLNAYYNAKQPLIDAFERFETDFSNGANGPIRPLSNESWENLLEAVKNAAIAKDVTDCYTQFAKEAEAFNAAMDYAEKEITGIDNSQKNRNKKHKFHDLWGRDINSKEKGHIYIINGQKVLF